jgi:hypothetical protein
MPKTIEPVTPDLVVPVKARTESTPPSVQRVLRVGHEGNLVRGVGPTLAMASSTAWGKKFWPMHDGPAAVGAWLTVTFSMNMTWMCRLRPVYQPGKIVWNSA